MFHQLIFAILLGILAGIFTGLIPGIHINLISLIVLTLTASLPLPTLIIGIFIISMAITHTFLDSIPSIYLGAPDEAMALAALPGHRMLMKGIGHHAILLTTIGSFCALLICIILAPSFLILVKAIYPIIRDYIGYILIAIMSYMILKDNKRRYNFLMFLASGILGLIVLNMHNLTNPLFPLLSGLFGFSILLTSLKNNAIPKQIKKELKIDKKILSKATTGATIVGFMASFLPGFGSSQAAIIATQFLKDIGDKGFLILVGGINTVNMTLSLITLYALEKARNGAVLTIYKINGAISTDTLILLFIAALISGAISVWLALHLSKAFAKMMNKVNYRMLIISILLFTSTLIFYFDSFTGLLILITATSIGLTAGELKVGKNHLMGCLIIPVILYFL